MRIKYFFQPSRWRSFGIYLLRRFLKKVDGSEWTPEVHEIEQYMYRYLSCSDCMIHRKGTIQDDDVQTTEKKVIRCKCKKVSILIHKHATIIMTGARTLAQIEDTYQRICKFFRSNIDNVTIMSDDYEVEIADDHMPDLIKSTITNQIYLKKALIQL